MRISAPATNRATKPRQAKVKFNHLSLFGGKPRLPRAFGLCVLLVCTFVAAGCFEGTTREVLATVLFVDAQPTLTRAHNRGSIPLTSDVIPGKGDLLETAEKSRAGLALLPNLLVQLDRNARLEIRRLAITKDGNETGASMQARYAEVKLLTGRMFASQAWGEAIAKFTVITAQGELVTTSNALFCVESDEHKTRVTCVSGSIEFRGRDAQTSTPIPPGFVGEWSASSASLVAAESDARGQEDLQEGLEVEEKLRALSSQRRLVLPR